MCWQVAELVLEVGVYFSEFFCVPFCFHFYFTFVSMVMIMAMSVVQKQMVVVCIVRAMISLVFASIFIQWPLFVSTGICRVCPWPFQWSLFGSLVFVFPGICRNLVGFSRIVSRLCLLLLFLRYVLVGLPFFFTGVYYVLSSI